MINIKDYLKIIGISKQEFAAEIKLSRPTLDSYIIAYENGEAIPRERYQIIFNELFGETLERDVFLATLERLKNLLERDERLGTDALDANAADMVSRLKDRMLQDMSQGYWNQSVYIFIDMLIANYRKNIIFQRLAEYFTFLNRSNLDDCAANEQIPYFAQFYRLFNSLLKDSITYDERDYRTFLKRREQIIRSRISEQEKKEENIKKLISDTVRELQKTGIDATETEILKAILDKFNK